MNGIARYTARELARMLHDRTLPVATILHWNLFILEVLRVLKGPVAWKAEFLRLNAVPLLGCDIQDVQLVLGFHTRINAEINWFQNIVVSVAEEVIDLDESDVSIARICWQIVNSGNPRIGFKVFLGVPASH